MTKEQAFDVQSAAQRAGVKSILYTADIKQSVDYGITLYKLEDLYKIGRALATDEGPLEIRLKPEDTQVHVL